ncbi:MAG: FHA domain-containing protein [Synechococcaceae cyanobacterium]
MNAKARLVMQHDPSKEAALDPARPLTIGQAASNRLCFPARAGVAAHHAVVRFSSRHGWIVCDWQSGAAGTWLRGQRLRRCRPLSDGDEIQLGDEGPVLVFQLAPQIQAVHTAAAPAPLTFAGRRIPLERIRSTHVRSRPRHPHSFSWWLLVCLGGLVMLPWPWLFWPLQIGAMAAWMVLGSRKEHEVIVTLQDGMAHHHGFANRITALGHCNGIRRAIGQGMEDR